MKIQMILVTMGIALGTATAFAGVADKKAMRESEETINIAADVVKQACGNAKLATKIDWVNWEKYDYVKLGKEKSEILRYTGGLAKSVLEAVVELCKYPDYKAEIAKLTNLAFSGKDDPTEYYVAFALNGTTLNIKLNGDGVDSWKNAELLKEVWK